MKRLKRFISIALCMCVLCGIVFTQAGFSCKKEIETFAVGDFEILKDSYSIKKGVYYVWGLSEQGEKAENLFIPIELEGKRLESSTALGQPKSDYKNTFINSNLKKLFLNDTKEYWDKFNKSRLFFHSFRNSFLTEFTMYLKNKSDFNKVILNGFFYDVKDLSWFVDQDFYKIEYDKNDKENRYTNRIYKYVNSRFFTTVLNGTIKNGEDAVYYRTIDYKRTLVDNFDTVSEMESVLDYMSGFHWSNNDFLYFVKTYRLANVQFMYNYEDSPQYGYYWIDDIENGERIEVIPEDPTREGYTFGGWYTEPECINEFDFNTQIIKQNLNWGEIFEFENEIPNDYITYLYSKWIEN